MAKSLKEQMPKSTLQYPSMVVDGVKKYEIEPGRWVTRQRVSQIQLHTGLPKHPQRVPDKDVRRRLEAIAEQAKTTNRLLAVLIATVAGLQRHRTVAELVDLLQPSGMSTNEIASALGTTAATLHVSVGRKRARGQVN